MVSQKTFKFYWVHIHLIQKLNSQELYRYCESVSMAIWPSRVKNIINQAIEERYKELSNINTKLDAMVLSSELKEFA